MYFLFNTVTHTYTCCSYKVSVCVWGKVHPGVPLVSCVLSALSLMNSVAHRCKRDPCVCVTRSVMNEKQLQ